jgi:hypothetical protein
VLEFRKNPAVDFGENPSEKAAEKENVWTEIV